MWSKVIQGTRMFQNYGESPEVFTARASFEDVVYGRPRTRGMVTNIKRDDILARKCCACCVKATRVPFAGFAMHIINALVMILSIVSINFDVPVYINAVAGLLWCLIPLRMVLSANTKIMMRIFRYSGFPYFVLYLSFLQTWALMDLFQYSAARLLSTIPPLCGGILTLVISDAVYILPSERSAAIIDVVFSLLWQVGLCFGVRFNKFPGLTPRGIIRTMGDDVLFQNASLFCGKGASIVMFLISQLIFRLRHPDQAYALRAHYTILSNANWAQREGRKRVFRALSLKADVHETRVHLGISPRARILKPVIEIEL